jgi:hypothetical protein
MYSNQELPVTQAAYLQRVKSYYLGDWYRLWLPGIRARNLPLTDNATKRLRPHLLGPLHSTEANGIIQIYLSLF